MDWDALGAIAELLGAVAVFMTLVYLAVQLKQNNAFAQAQAMQARTDTQLNMISFVLSDPKYLRSIRKTVSSIDASEKIRRGVRAGCRSQASSRSRVVPQMIAGLA